MASFLDLGGLTHFWEKSKSYIDSSISTAKTAVGSYTINNKKISTNPTITKADLGLQNAVILENNGKISSEYLPSFVDDMLEFGTEMSSSSGVTIQTSSASSPDHIVYLRDKDTFVASTSKTDSPSGTYYANWGETDTIRKGEAYGTATNNGYTPKTGVIYVNTTGGKSYRYAGSSSKLVLIASDLALGETSSTAYRGDHGKTAYDHANAHGSAFDNSGNVGLFKIKTNSAGHVTAATAVTKTDITNLGIPGSDSNPQFQVYHGETKETLGTSSTGSSLVGVPSIISSTNTSTTRAQRLSFPQFGLKKDSTGVYMELLTDSLLSAIPTATTSADGLMSSEDKTKLNGLKNYTLPKATESTMGGIKLGGDNVISSTTVTEAATSVSSKIYAVQLNSAGKAVVNVPWTDTNTTYGIATASTAGLVKPASVITKPSINTASTDAGKYYHVQMSSDGAMFVNVPWKDTNTTYTAITDTQIDGIF